MPRYGFISAILSFTVATSAFAETKRKKTDPLTAVQICSVLLMPTSMLKIGPNNPLMDKLEDINEFMVATLEIYKKKLASNKPIPEEHIRVLAQPNRYNPDYFRITYGLIDDLDLFKGIMQTLELYVHQRLSPTQLLRIKAYGYDPERIANLQFEEWGKVVNPDKSHFDDVLLKIFINRQRLENLIRSQKTFREEAARQKDVEWVDKSADEDLIPKGRKKWRYGIDTEGLPDSLRHLTSIQFSDYTERHSFPHFSQGIVPQTLADALLLSRDNLTSVVSIGLSVRDIFQYLHTLEWAKEFPVSIRFDLESWHKNVADGKYMVPIEMTIPLSHEKNDSDAIKLRLVVCAKTPCQPKGGLRYDVGEIISVIPLSGPGVVRLPPSRILKRAMAEGKVLFDPKEFEVQPRPQHQ